MNITRGIAFLAFAAASASLAAAETYDLTVDHLPEARNVTAPVFGWKMRSSREGARQAAYRLKVTERGGKCVWDSGEVADARSAAVRYAGPALANMRHYGVSVAVKDETGKWLEPSAAEFTTGMVDTNGWRGSVWIEDPKAPQRDMEFVRKPKGIGQDGGYDAPKGTSWFRKAFASPKPVKEAFWTVTALGVFDAYVNGRTVGSDFLKPGYTSHFHRRHALTYDVTDLLSCAAGVTNVLMAEVSSAWWNDRISVWYGGNRHAFRGVLVLRHPDGTETQVGTGTDWQAAQGGGVTWSGIYEGEHYDARNPDPRRHPEMFHGCQENREFSGVIASLPGPTTVCREDLALSPAQLYVWKGTTPAEGANGSVNVIRRYADGDEIELKPGETLVVDFGQNAAAVPDMVLSGARGTEVTLDFGEVVNAPTRKDDPDYWADGPAGSIFRKNLAAAAESCKYTCSGEGSEHYRTRFSFFGYRFASVTATGDVRIRRLRSVPVTSVHRGMERATFEAADPAVSRLAKNCLWSLYSNYLSVPTDCPQRGERLGWTGDAQVFSEAAAYLSDIYAFMLKWSDDMTDSRDANGNYVSAMPRGKFGYAGPMRFAWCDAAIICPYRAWMASGDDGIIRRSWVAMDRYARNVDAVRYRLDGRAKSAADWLSKERYERWGRNGETTAGCDKDPNAHAFYNFLAGCYWLQDARMMERMAAAIGKAEDAAFYRASARRAMEMLRTEFLEQDGGVLKSMSDMQTPAAFAVAHGVLDEKGLRLTGERLMANLRAHGGCLQTGMLGTPFLLDALTDGLGRPDVAYGVFLQKKWPGWFFQIANGATTMWERWNAYDLTRGGYQSYMCSHNHPVFGSVFAWMMRTVAGIRPDPAEPGYRHFVLKPVPDRRLGWVRATYDSPYGVIESHWKYDAAGKWTWTFVIPPNASATVVLPDGTKKEYGPGCFKLQGSTT